MHQMRDQVLLDLAMDFSRFSGHKILIGVIIAITIVQTGLMRVIVLAKGSKSIAHM